MRVCVCDRERKALKYAVQHTTEHETFTMKSQQVPYWGYCIKMIIY